MVIFGRFSYVFGILGGLCKNCPYFFVYEPRGIATTGVFRARWCPMWSVRESVPANGVCQECPQACLRLALQEHHIITAVQRESNMHRIEVHHVASPCDPQFLAGENSGFIQEILYQSRFLVRGCDEALFSEKKGVFSEKGGGNSVNQGFGKDFYRKGNSVKRFGRFSEPPDSGK